MGGADWKGPGKRHLLAVPAEPDPAPRRPGRDGDRPVRARGGLRASGVQPIAAAGWTYRVASWPRREGADAVAHQEGRRERGCPGDRTCRSDNPARMVQMRPTQVGEDGAER